MKRFFLFAISVSLLAMSACVSNGSKQNTSNQIEWSEPKYSIGDIVVIGNEMGVVFDVTTDGQHGKAMSVSQTRCSWESARSWCRKFGSGWRLPSISELKIISNKRDVLDSTLVANGYKKVWGCLWSSSYAEYVHVGNGHAGIDYYKDGHNYVRAVSAF